jgi:mono/diheme cytochrome c family protein
MEEIMKKDTLIILSVYFITLSISSVAFGQVKMPTKTAELITQGKKLYQQNCLPCHGDKGDGKGPVGAVLQPPANDFTKPLKEWPTTKGDPQKIFEVISKGIPNTGMVAWTQFPEQERWALVYTVIEFATPAKVPPSKAPPEKKK